MHLVRVSANGRPGALWLTNPPSPNHVRLLVGGFGYLLRPFRTKSLLWSSTPSTAAICRVRRTWSASARRSADSAAVGDGPSSPESGPSVCVIGAGAAGLAAGRCLRDVGCRVTILERSRHGVGGLWRSDPGAKTPMCESTRSVVVASLFDFVSILIVVDRHDEHFCRARYSAGVSSLSANMIHRVENCGSLFGHHPRAALEH